MNKNKVTQLFEYIGLIAFLIVYKFSPSEYATQYAAIAIIIASIVQFAYFFYYKIKMPNHVLGLNLLSLFLNIPAAIYNDFIFIRIKLLIIKIIMFVVPLGFTLFGKNFFYFLFKDMAGFNIFTKREFNIINYWYLFTALISLIITVYAYFNLSDDAFVNLKTVWLPIVGMLYIFPVFYFGVKHAKQEEEK